MNMKKVLEILKKHKIEIGWTLTYIFGISSSMGMHKILLEDGEKAVRQPQRRHNPLILDVIKNEIYIAPKYKENTIFTCPFYTFTYRRMFFNPRIKSEDIDKNFKFNGHCLKLFHKSPILEEETI